MTTETLPPKTLLPRAPDGHRRRRRRLHGHPRSGLTRASPPSSACPGHETEYQDFSPAGQEEFAAAAREALAALDGPGAGGRRRRRHPRRHARAAGPAAGDPRVGLGRRRAEQHRLPGPEHPRDLRPHAHRHRGAVGAHRRPGAQRPRRDRRLHRVAAVGQGRTARSPRPARSRS